MVYYVRYLKTPRIQQQKGSSCIAALICITTDLGDSFLAEDVDLSLTVRGEKTRFSSHEVRRWNAYDRELSITLPLSAQLAGKTLVLTVELQRPQSTSEINVPSFPLPLVIGATSASFGPHSTPADKLLWRDLKAFGIPVQIWEETGNSIARHIWDAGLATVVYLQKTLEDVSKRATVRREKGNDKEIPLVGSNLSALVKVLSTARDAPLQVVELGAGCGIVGIGLAHMHPNCSVLLTDLPEVEDIMTQNLASSQSAAMSRVGYQNLDWEHPPDNLCSQPIELILVSDCTYNADSLPVLVSCLNRLARASPGAIILVSLKKRHESEMVFFDLMRSVGFTSEQQTMELPSQHGEVDEIEFHCYSRGG